MSILMLKIHAASCLLAFHPQRSRLVCTCRKCYHCWSRITIVMSLVHAQSGESELINLGVALGKCLPRRVKLCLDVLVDFLKAGLQKLTQLFLRRLVDACRVIVVAERGDEAAKNSAHFLVHVAFSHFQQLFEVLLLSHTGLRTNSVEGGDFALEIQVALCTPANLWLVHDFVLASCRTVSNLA